MKISKHPLTRFTFPIPSKAYDIALDRSNRFTINHEYTRKGKGGVVMKIKTNN